MKRINTILRTFGVMAFLGIATLALPLPAHRAAVCQATLSVQAGSRSQRAAKP